MLKYEIINALHLSCSGFAGDLDQHQVTLPEVRLASDALEQIVSPEIYEKIEDAVDALALQNERQGFINGFQLGMKLALEVAT